MPSVWEEGMDEVELLPPPSCPAQHTSLGPTAAILCFKAFRKDESYDSQRREVHPSCLTTGWAPPGVSLFVHRGALHLFRNESLYLWFISSEHPRCSVGNTLSTPFAYFPCPILRWLSRSLLEHLLTQPAHLWLHSTYSDLKIETKSFQSHCYPHALFEVPCGCGSD